MVRLGMDRTSRDETESLLHNSEAQNEETSKRAKIKGDHLKENRQAGLHGTGQRHSESSRGPNTRNSNNNNAPTPPASSPQNVARNLKAQKMQETWNLTMKWTRLFTLTATFIVIDVTLYLFTSSSDITIPIGAVVGVEACLGVIGGFVALAFAIPSIEDDAPLDVNHILCKIPSFCVFYCAVLHIICMGAAMEALSKVWPPIFVSVLGIGLVVLTGQVWWYSGDGRGLPVVIDTEGDA